MGTSKPQKSSPILNIPEEVWGLGTPESTGGPSAVLVPGLVAQHWSRPLRTQRPLQNGCWRNTWCRLSDMGVVLVWGCWPYPKTYMIWSALKTWTMQHYSLAINNRRPGVLGEITEIVLHHLRDYKYIGKHTIVSIKENHWMMFFCLYSTEPPVPYQQPFLMSFSQICQWIIIQYSLWTQYRKYTHTSYIIFICISYIVFTSYIIVANPGHPIQLKSSAVSLTYTVSGLYPKMIDHIYHFTIISLDYYKYIYP